ncbi:MAG: sulfatase family protein [Planctomycetota bacterium]|jgi:choline-sulfatase
METDEKKFLRSRSMNRREFLRACAVCATGLAASSIAGCVKEQHQGIPFFGKAKRPNILFINIDQQSINAISAHGCEYVRTPNMDRLAARGTTFLESHSADPICCPARTSWFTGRMSCEHAVVFNNTPMVKSMPDMGRWLRDDGYEAVHAGKWHIPGRKMVDSFDIVYGEHWIGEYADESVARSAEAYLRNRRSSKPFFLVVGLLQPHDICYWIMQNKEPAEVLRYPEIAGQLPPLPPNFHYDKREPQFCKQLGSHKWGVGGKELLTDDWTQEHWRYYRWAYYRQVEMVDAVVGHVLDALEDSGHADDTIIIFTSDHGEGQGHHQKTNKDFLYEEVLKVPLIISCPGRLVEGRKDSAHLVSGVDILPTVCDFAGIEPPPDQRGYSLRPLVEDKCTGWREFVAAESFVNGRMIRTQDYKYIMYKGDPIEQLFDMKSDPWEIKNLAAEGGYASVLEDHRKLLASWESKLKPAPAPEGGWLDAAKKKKKKKKKT